MVEGVRWLLIVFASGVLPPAAAQVDNLPSKQACEHLGDRMIADFKVMNGGSRYFVRCYEVEPAPTVTN